MLTGTVDAITIWPTTCGSTSTPSVADRVSLVDQSSRPVVASSANNEVGLTPKTLPQATATPSGPIK